MELFVIRTWALSLCLFVVCAASPRPAEAREIPVTIITDPMFEQLPQWRGIVQSAFRKALEDFPAMSGWKPVIHEWTTYDFKGRHDTYSDALEEIAVETEFQNGVVIYFAGRQFAQENRRGFALLDRRMVAVALDSRKEMTYTLRHEFGHLMGLPHCPGKNIMAEISTKRTWEFTPLAKDALSAVRGMALGNAPLFFGADLGKLQEIHAAWNEAGYGDARITSRLEAALNPPVESEEE